MYISLELDLQILCVNSAVDRVLLEVLAVYSVRSIILVGFC